MPLMLPACQWIVLASVTPGGRTMGSLLMGLAVGGFLGVMASIVGRALAGSAPSWDFEERRKARIRARCATFRWLEPLIIELHGFPGLAAVGRSRRVARDLQAGGSPLPWTPDEFLATKAVEGLALGVAVGWFVGRGGGVAVGLAFFLATAVGWVWRESRQLHRAARERTRRLKQRLPFATDLMALMMEAGAGRRQALEAVVRECADHPLGEEFGRVLQADARGRSFAEALEDLQQRLADDDINEMIFAVKKAEELGTPLSQIFLSLAEQMRLKRSQWAEKRAGEAQAMITFPGMVIMVACLLIVVAPFLLGAMAEAS